LCRQDEEAQSRSRHMLLPIDAGARDRSKTALINSTKQRINTLNECFTNNEIDLN
ncbi:unnamed protein product, partial [Rotaria sp. Silwood1]